MDLSSVQRGTSTVGLQWMNRNARVGRAGRGWVTEGLDRQERRGLPTGCSEIENLCGCTGRVSFCHIHWPFMCDVYEKPESLI